MIGETRIAEGVATDRHTSRSDFIPGTSHKVNTIANIAECVSLATQLKRDWFPDEPTWGPWFRGHSDAAWKLTPKLYRVKSPKRGIRIIEDEIRQEFIMRAPGLAHPGQLTSWEWYFTMQHFGAPTRLLDWTEGALIALYFAVRYNPGDTDSAIWILDPWWLNLRVLKEREVIPPGAVIGISASDADRYKPWLPDRYSKDELPKPCVAIYPTHSERRISTQRSCFTIHGYDESALEILASESDAHIAKVTIPRSEVLSIREQLVVAGIDETTIFPDLDGLGRYLNAVLESEADASMNIEFREVAVPEEIEALLDFDRKAFASFPADLFDAEEWAQFKSHWMIVDGEIVGCSAIVHDADFDETARPGSLWIASTGIVPQHRRKGFGKLLKEWQISYAREHGFKVIVTNMRKSNSPILVLNTKLGFTIREISPEYYPDPVEDAIVMELRL